MGLNTINGLLNTRNTSFAQAIAEDLGRFETQCFSVDDISQIWAPIVQIKEYPGESQIQEYFTRILVHIPIHYAITHPQATEEELFIKLRYYFSKTIQWFEALHPVCSITPAIDQTLFGNRTVVSVSEAADQSYPAASNH